MHGAVKSAIKTILFPGGKQPRTVRLGIARGLKFLIDPAEKSQRLLGLDERELSGALVSAIRSAGTFIDIGASDGYYTIIAAARNRSARVIGCEPGAGLGLDYDENLRLNGLDKEARIERRAVFVSTGRTTLDELTAGCREPIVVKIDVEGGELDVLRSGPETMSRDTTFLIETHSLELERQCVDLLEGDGYICQVIRPAWWRGLVPEQRPSAHNQWLVATRRS